MSTLCPTHAAEHESWLDYRPPPVRPTLVAIGGGSVRDALEARRGRFQAWRETIRTQQRLVREACQNGCRKS